MNTSKWCTSNTIPIALVCITIQCTKWLISELLRLDYDHFWVIHPSMCYNIIPMNSWQMIKFIKFHNIPEINRVCAKVSEEYQLLTEINHRNESKKKREERGRGGRPTCRSENEFMQELHYRNFSNNSLTIA